MQQQFCVQLAMVTYYKQYLLVLYVVNRFWGAIKLLSFILLFQKKKKTFFSKMFPLTFGSSRGISAYDIYSDI